MDKYQGQQNDYVLLYLYVFGRKELFGNCYELQATFK